MPRTLTSVPAAIDHMARLKPADSPEHQTWRMVIDLLKRENYWVMLSNGVCMSAQKGLG